MQRWMGEQVTWATPLAAARGLHQSPDTDFFRWTPGSPWHHRVRWERRMGALEVGAKAKGRKSAGLGSQVPWRKALAESFWNNLFGACQTFCLPSQAGKGEHMSTWADQNCDGNFSGYPLQNNCRGFTLLLLPRKQPPRSVRDLFFFCLIHPVKSCTHHCSKTFANCNLDMPSTYSAAHEQKALLVLWIIPSNTRCCLISPDWPTPTIL